MVRFNHSSTAAWLRSRLLYCDVRWERAMARKGYLDEPPPDRCFTEDELQLYCWADDWRQQYHWYEEELIRVVKAGLLLGLSTPR